MIDKQELRQRLSGLSDWIEIESRFDRWFELSVSSASAATKEEESLLELLLSGEGPGTGLGKRLDEAAKTFWTVVNTLRGQRFVLIEEGEDWYSRDECEQKIRDSPGSQFFEKRRR